MSGQYSHVIALLSLSPEAELWHEEKSTSWELFEVKSVSVKNDATQVQFVTCGQDSTQELYVSFTKLPIASLSSPSGCSGLYKSAIGLATTECMGVASSASLTTVHMLLFDGSTTGFFHSAQLNLSTH